MIQSILESVLYIAIYDLFDIWFSTYRYTCFKAKVFFLGKSIMQVESNFCF